MTNDTLDVMRDFTKIDATIEAFERLYQIDPHGIYCLLTGKQIGRSNPSELFDLIDSMPDSDPEDRADDLAMRLFASMRPSMRWNKMRVESLDIMRKSAPTETLAYLLNRLFAPLDRKKSYITEHGERINLFNHLSSFGDQAKVQESIHLLLEIDVRLNLSLITGSFTAQTIITKCANADDLVGLLTPWYVACLDKFERLAAESRYMQSNPLAKQAFFNSYLESKPQSKTASLRSAKQQENDFFASLYESLEGNKPTPQPVVKAMETRAKVTPVFIRHNTIAPRSFGVKKVSEIES